MQVGTLVMHESDQHQGMGVVIDECSQAFKGHLKHKMVKVHWLDGMGVGLYWTDELEVICK